MVFEIVNNELASLILYAAQQLGVVLAVGGQTCVLVAYVLAMRDRSIDATEALFARAVRTVLFAGLALIVFSGAGITITHYAAGDIGTLLEPAYLFKWLLIAVGALCALGMGGQFNARWANEGFAGATWYALFFVHILAPVTSWENLALLYVGWLAAFFLCWTALVFGTRLPAQAGERKATGVVSVAQTPPPKPPASATNSTSLPDIPSIKAQPPPASPLPPLAPKPTPSPASTIPPPSAPKPARPLTPPPTPAPATPLAATSVPLIRPVHIPMQPSVPVPAKPADADQAHPGLPAIRVMPKAPPPPQ